MIRRRFVGGLEYTGLRYVLGSGGGWVLSLFDLLVGSKLEGVGTCTKLTGGCLATVYMKIDAWGALCPVAGTQIVLVDNCVNHKLWHSDHEPQDLAGREQSKAIYWNPTRSAIRV